jgi:YHS domain-containing protein
MTSTAATREIPTTSTTATWAITAISTTAVKDPVCVMDIEPATATEQTEHKGQTYYFCSSRCKERFDVDPKQYVGTSPLCNFS